MPRDSSKEYSLEDIYTAAEKTRAPIYAVIPGVRFAGVPPEEHVERARRLFGKLFQLQQELGGWGRQLTPTFENYLRSRAQTALRQQLALAGIANLTGGWAEYLEEPEHVAEIYDRIFLGMGPRPPPPFSPTKQTREGKLRRGKKEAGHPGEHHFGEKNF